MKMNPVQSSAIKALGHENDTLFVEYASGGTTYQIPGVSVKQYDDLLNADSIGKAVAKLAATTPAVPVDDDKK